MANVASIASVVGFAALVASLAGCNALLGNEGWTAAPEDGVDGGLPWPGGGDSGSAGQDDTSVPNDDSSTTMPPVDSSSVPPDTGVDTGFDSGLSSKLVLPPAGSGCDPLQGDADCSSGTTCRISSSTFGTCDSFTSGHEGGWPCSTDEDCDDTLQCYAGECKVLCPLGANCAGGCLCFSVGNQDMGLCCPGG